MPVIRLKSLTGKKKLKLSDYMSSSRIPKVEDFLKKEISQIISAQVQDQRFKLLNIVDVKASADLGLQPFFLPLLMEIKAKLLKRNH